MGEEIRLAEFWPEAYESHRGPKDTTFDYVAVEDIVAEEAKEVSYKAELPSLHHAEQDARMVAGKLANFLRAASSMKELYYIVSRIADFSDQINIQGELAASNSPFDWVEVDLFDVLGTLAENVEAEIRTRENALELEKANIWTNIRFNWIKQMIDAFSTAKTIAAVNALFDQIYKADDVYHLADNDFAIVVKAGEHRFNVLQKANSRRIAIQELDRPIRMKTVKGRLVISQSVSNFDQLVKAGATADQKYMELYELL